MKASGAHSDTDSDPSEELPLAARVAAAKTSPPSGGSNAAAVVATEVAKPPTAVEPPPAAHPTPDTPPTTTVQTKADRKRSHKKKGRNQYTRDRDVRDEESPARSQSRDIQKDEHGPSTNSKGGGEGGGKAHPKARGGMSSKVTMNDMKRRTTALLDFISRTQMELVGEPILGATAESPGTANGTSAAGSERTNEAGHPPAVVSGEHGEPHPQREFKELGCMEMMDSLTGRLLKWQQQYTA